VPICFVGLASIVGIIRRGAYVALPDPICCTCFHFLRCTARPCCSICCDGCKIKADYKEDAAAALKGGEASAFQKSRSSRRAWLEFTSVSVLLGVMLLLPIYSVLLGISTAGVAVCDAVAAGGTPAIDFAAISAASPPIVGFAKAVSDDLLASQPLDVSQDLTDAMATVAPSTIVQALLSALTLPGVVASVELTSIQSFLGSLATIDLATFLPATCTGGGGWPFDGGWYGLDFWIKTMYLGLWLHLPGAVFAWHFLWRYTILMRLQDMPEGGKKEMV